MTAHLSTAHGSPRLGSGDSCKRSVSESPSLTIMASASRRSLSESGSEQPAADGGAVVNITTATLTELPAGSSLYSSSKAALAALTVVAAKELAPRGIRVNAVAPTATRTERTQQYAGLPAETQMIERIPLGRLGTPADVGEVVVFLASDAARFLTGDTLHVSGGQV